MNTLESSVQESPLFIPVLWDGDRFRILDETQIPLRTEYITVTEPRQAIQAVREMKTRAFGQVLTFIYAAALATQSRRVEALEEARPLIQQLAGEFTEARPTFDFEGIGALLLKKVEAQAALGAAPQPLVERIVNYGDGIVAARQARAGRTAALLPDRCRLLTHCNVSGELVAVAEHCRRMGKKIEFIATETRPYFQGSRLTAWELARAGVKISLIPDAAIAQVMARKEVDAAIVGSDRCAQNGDVINKVGTYPIALMAKDYGLPFYALVQNPGKLATGAQASIEERPAAELLEFHGRSTAPEGVGGRYPAFDVTPAALVSRLIGFEGTFTPDEFRQKYGGEIPSTAVKATEGGDSVLIWGVPHREDHRLIANVLKDHDASAVLLPEMRPELWGARLEAQRLMEDRLPVTLIADNMMGTFFAQGKIKYLMLFYYQITDAGVRGAPGSLLAARLARAHGVWIELIPAGPVPQKPQDADVTTFLGERLAPEGVGALRIEEEVMPWELFRAVWKVSDNR